MTYYRDQDIHEQAGLRTRRRKSLSNRSEHGVITMRDKTRASTEGKRVLVLRWVLLYIGATVSAECHKPTAHAERRWDLKSLDGALHRNIEDG